MRAVASQACQLGLWHLTIALLSLTFDKCGLPSLSMHNHLLLLLLLLLLLVHSR
jgi:hypothetical protein